MDKSQALSVSASASITRSVCDFVCLFGFLTSSSTTRLYGGRAPRQERLTILRAATHETELGDHDFCLSRSHYTDTDPTCRERAATAGIEPETSSPGVARSTAELPPPPPPPPVCDSDKKVMKSPVSRLHKLSSDFVLVQPCFFISRSRVADVGSKPVQTESTASRQW